MLRRYVCPSLGERLLTALRPLDLQINYQQMTERGLSARTVRYTHAVLRSAIRQALSKQLATRAAELRPEWSFPRFLKIRAFAHEIMLSRSAGGILTNFGSNPNATAFALAIQSNGDIIAAGQAGSSLALSRYSSAGKLDTTFGSSGTVTTSLGSNASAISSLAIQSDGKIVAAGSIFTVNGQFEAQAAVARYLAQ
jgi:uncharacterized delta-60 repeat protein